MVHLLLEIIYLSFISLGLPDGLLGSAWPSMYPQFQVSVSCAGIVSMIISAGTIASSLLSDRLTYRLGTGKVTALSVGLTCAALFGFSCAEDFPMLCLWAIPYGLGAGCVDAALNNYVALHYTSRHMSWLHCMWGLGAMAGPYIMGFVLSGGGIWNSGYRYVGMLQILLTVILFLSLPLWKKRPGAEAPGTAEAKPLPLGSILKISGAREVLVAFFCYCALEQTAILWGSSYLALYRGLSTETAAFYGSMFFIGITAGRGLNGFLTLKFTDTQLIRMGQGIILAGIAAMLLPLGTNLSIAGLILIGLGCAPIYPCIIHSTPDHFGEENSQAIIGVQMASAYVGICLMPPLFGLIANHIGAWLLPVYVGAINVVMILMSERLNKKTS